MRLHGVCHRFGLAVPSGDPPADQRVWPLDLVRDCLPDVVEEGSSASRLG
jgi:hypothetical protein